VRSCTKGVASSGRHDRTTSHGNSASRRSACTRSTPQQPSRKPAGPAAVRAAAVSAPRPSSSASATARPSGAMTAAALSTPHASRPAQAGVRATSANPGDDLARRAGGRRRQSRGPRPLPHQAEQQGGGQHEGGRVDEQRPRTPTSSTRAPPARKPTSCPACATAFVRALRDDVALAGRDVGEQGAAGRVERRRQQADEHQDGEDAHSGRSGTASTAMRAGPQQVGHDHRAAARRRSATATGTARRRSQVR
jgi:hypothetical protein